MIKSESPEWEKLHEEANLFDLHAHPSLKATVFRRSMTGPVWVPPGLHGLMNPLSVRTSFVNLEKGKVDIQMSSIYAPERRLLDEIRAFKIVPLRFIRYLPFSLARRLWREFISPDYFTVTLNLLRDMEVQVERHNRNAGAKRPAVMVKDADELGKLIDEGPSAPIALVHSVEGAHSLEGAISRRYEGQPWDQIPSKARKQVEDEVMGNLEKLFEMGVAYLILAHFFPSRVVTPVFPFPEHVAFSSVPEHRVSKLFDDLKLTNGLTDLGKKVVQRMIEMGMIIDISHCTPVARRQVYELVEKSQRKAPIVTANHVGAQAINPSPYNLADWEIEWIINHRGLIGVIFMSYWLFPSDRRFGLDFIARHIDYLIKAGGEDIVGIGSDFDGADPPDDIADSSQMPRLTQRLLAEFSTEGRKYSDQQIKKILGANAVRFFLEAWGKG